MAARLPVQMTSTIGRDNDIATLVARLRQEDVRLLTLTGPGGVGKTRLSLEVARALSADFADGIFFVSLAALREPGQLIRAIAQAMEIDEISGIGEPDLALHIREFLRKKDCLLLLDNFEHLLSQVKLISGLLADSLHFKVLVTSREMLHLYGEQEYVVSPLALPELSGPEAGATSAAMALFVARVQAVRPLFALTAENRQAIAEICIQLDGLPLAIELAAARGKLLSPQAILMRLRSRLKLLVGGARDLPERQQTLRNTLDWSYNLLNADEQRFFRRLGVLRGNWSCESAGAVAGEDTFEAFSFLTSLVDKSLVLPVESTATEVRFLLLETIREYALERLMQHGEEEETQRRHALFYLELAESLEPHLQGAHQREGLRSLDQEMAHLSGALRWTIERGERELALRLASALREYLPLRSSPDEGRQWFEEILALDHERQPGILRARVLYGAGALARQRSDLALARERLAESRAILSEVDDPSTLALVLGLQAQLELSPGNYAAARALVEEGLQITERTNSKWCRGILHRIAGNVASKQCDFTAAQTRYVVSLMLLRGIGDQRNEAETLTNLGSMMRLRGKFRTAHYLYARGLMLFQDLGDRWGQLACLNCLGEALSLRGDYVQAQNCFAESYALAQLLGDRAELVITLIGSGHIALCQAEDEQAARSFHEARKLAREIDSSSALMLTLSALGDLERTRGSWQKALDCYTSALELAKTSADRLAMMNIFAGMGEAARGLGRNGEACTWLKQSLHIAWEIGHHMALATSLESLAWLCRQVGQPEHAALLLGSAYDLRETLQTPLAPVYRAGYERDLAALKAEIGQRAFSECWSEGRSLLLAQVMAMPVAQVHITETATRVSEPVEKRPYALTAREMDVLRLLAEGYADARIARLLVISPRTVNTHLRSIYSKLGVSTRSAATRIAVEQKLL